MRDNLRIFLLPLGSYIVIAVWCVFWIGGAAAIFSIGNPEPREDGFPFLTEIKWTSTTRYAFFYDVFGLFWVTAFIIGTTQFIIGCSACLWYFEKESPSKGQGTVGKAFWWAYRYHLGSVAFGSFLIAVCQMIRFLFEYYRKKMGVAKESKFVKVMLCITRYLLWIMEKCVKFITKNAYIQVALTNNHFCKSAWHGFVLILKNVTKFGATKSIGGIFMFFGGVSIAVTNMCIGYAVITHAPRYAVVSSPLPSVICIGVISVLIAYPFLSIFSFSSDAILQSFLLDEELRFQGKARPEYV